MSVGREASPWFAGDFRAKFYATAEQLTRRRRRVRGGFPARGERGPDALELQGPDVGVDARGEDAAAVGLAARRAPGRLGEGRRLRGDRSVGRVVGDDVRVARVGDVLGDVCLLYTSPSPRD